MAGKRQEDGGAGRKLPKAGGRMPESRSPGRQSPGEGGRRVRKASGFLTVGRASRGDGGFVRRLLETVGNTVTAQMGEGAGGFLLPKRDGPDAYLTGLPNLHSTQHDLLPPRAQVVHAMESPCLSSLGGQLKGIQGREDPGTVSLATWEPSLRM